MTDSKRVTRKNRGVYVTGRTLSRAIQTYRGRVKWSQLPTRQITDDLLDLLDALPEPPASGDVEALERAAFLRGVEFGRAESAGLDVERLARALYETRALPDSQTLVVFRNVAERAAAEYARLTEAER